MKRINPALLETYLRSDPVSQLAAKAKQSAVMTSQRWLDETPAKRLIYHELYADCLSSGGPASMLDVGGGLTALTPLLAKGRRYGLIDPLFHETPDGMTAIQQTTGGFEHLDSDWHGVETGGWDLIVANDLFPNVDQRLYFPRGQAGKVNRQYGVGKRAIHLHGLQANVLVGAGTGRAL